MGAVSGASDALAVHAAALSVLARHADSIRIVSTLCPFAVAMAG